MSKVLTKQVQNKISRYCLQPETHLTETGITVSPRNIMTLRAFLPQPEIC